MPPCFSAAHLKENKKISINLYRPFPSGERRYCFTDLPLFLFPALELQDHYPDDAEQRTDRKNDHRYVYDITEGYRRLRPRRCRRSDVTCFPVYKSNGEGIAPRMGSRDIARDSISADSVGCCKNRIRACRNGGYWLRRLCRLIVDDVRGSVSVREADSVVTVSGGSYVVTLLPADGGATFMRAL